MKKILSITISVICCVMLVFGEGVKPQSKVLQQTLSDLTRSQLISFSSRQIDLNEQLMSINAEVVKDRDRCLKLNQQLQKDCEKMRKEMIVISIGAGALLGATVVLAFYHCR